MNEKNIKPSLRNIYNKRNNLASLVLFLTFVVLSSGIYMFYNYQDIYTEQEKNEYYSFLKKQHQDEIHEKNIELLQEGEKSFFTFDRENFDELFPTEFWKHRHFLTFFMTTIALILFISIAINILKGKPFICKHCLKSILPKMLIPFKCPFCDTENNLFSNLIKKCKECGSVIPAVDCPHCKNQIDLLEPYDVEKLEKKRYGKKI